MRMASGKTNGGFGRGFSHSNGIEVQQTPTGRLQPDRQEENWSTPTNVGRREIDTERHETSQAPPPNVPPPTEDRLFTDWSSRDSPRDRESQHNASARSREPNVTLSNDQAEQSRIETTRNEAMGNTLSDVMTIPSTHQQLSQVVNQVDIRLMDGETNTSEIEVKSQREETRMNILSSHDRGVQMPTSHSGISSHETDIIRGSPVRTCITDVIPQLDGPSIHTSRRPEQEHIRSTAMVPRGEYPGESDSDSYDNRRPRDG